MFTLGASLLVVVATERSGRAADLTAAQVWMTDFAKAQAEATKLHRPLVVHFHTKWCGPCRQMEKDILHTPQILRQLDEGFIAVKVDLDNKVDNAKVQAQYRVKNMPTDLILSHDGKELHRSEGYDPKNHQRLFGTYFAALTQVDSKYAREGLRLARMEPASGPKELAKNDPTPIRSEPVPGNKLVPEPIDPQRIGEPAPSTTPRLPEKSVPTTTVASRTIIAIDGYCPVTLRTTRAWKRGIKQLSVEHEGQTYLFVNAEHREEFISNPTRYAPRLLGCDAVLLAERRVAVRGSTKFGAYYDGELFLFESAESRARFRKAPASYSHPKHALKPEDVKDQPHLASAAAN
jgi:YHS domain-containing protein/thiol-disulfide isomerase/thioredoxin